MTLRKHFLRAAMATSICGVGGIESYAIAAESGEREAIAQVLAQKEARIAADRAAAEKTKLAEQAVIEADLRVVRILPDGVIASPVGEGRKGPPKTTTVERYMTLPTQTRPGMAADRGSKIKEQVDAREKVTLNALVFIACPVNGYFDGKTVRLKFWPAGIYRNGANTLLRYSIIRPD